MALPFRTSPTVKHTRLFSQSKRHTPKPLFLQTITPTDSEEEDSPPFANDTITQQPEAPQLNTSWGQDVCGQPDIVMDMGSPKQQDAAQYLDVDSMVLSPRASPCSLLPSHVNNLAVRDSASGGRLPTPIYGCFQPNVEAKMGGSPDSAQIRSPLEKDHGNHMRARRLPTPISEDEAMDVFHDPECDDANDIFEIPHARLRQPARFAPPLPYQSLKRGKPMFSMGFRADCDMCRNKVPGHYNHFFRA